MEIFRLSVIKSLFFENTGLHQTIFKNSFWLTFAEIVDSGIGFLVIAWMARYFGPVNYGQWAFALSFVSFFVVFADFGLSALVVREIARNKEKSAEYIDNILAIKFVLGIITFLFIIFFIQFLGKGGEEVKLVYWLGIYTIINTFGGFSHAIFKAYEKMQYETLSRIIQGVTLMGLTIFVIFSNQPIFFMSLAYLVSATIGAIISFLLIWKSFSTFFVKIDLKIIKEILMETWPIGLSSLTVAVYYFFAPVFLGVVRPSSEVGFYNAAFQTSFLIAPLSVILFSSFFPSIAVNFKDNAEKLHTIYQKYTTLSFMVAVPFLFGGLTVAPQLITFLYKWPYYDAILPFQILVLGMAVGFISSEMSGFLLAFNKQKDVFFSTLVGAVVNVLLNVMLVPRYGVVGAAIAATIAIIAVFLTCFWKFKKIIHGEALIKYSINPLIASVAMTLVIVGSMKMGLANPLLLIGLGVISYFAFLYIVMRPKGFLANPIN